MSDPLRKTFEYLTRSGNPEARRLLVRGLQTESPVVRRLAVNALIRRGESGGQTELVRRFRSFPPGVREQIASAHASLNNAVRDALRSSDRALRDAALQFVRQTHGFAHTESMLRLMLGGGTTAQAAFETLHLLVGRLEEQATGGDRVAASTRRTRDATVLTIAEWLARFRTTPFLPDLVQAVLVLGAAESRAVRHLLLEAEPDIVETGWRCLETGTNRGIARLLVGLLQRDTFVDRAAKTLEDRDEPEFVVQFLRSLPADFSEKQRTGLQRLRRFAWLDTATPDLDWIPDDGQAALGKLVHACGMPAEEKLAVCTWLLRHGSRAGRLAAAELLAETNPDLVEDAVFDSLQADDVDVQVWATSKLRDRPSPAAFSELIRQLDNPATAVRDTAQDELHSFDASLLLELFDDLTPQICKSAGQLAEKIDAATADELIAQFRHPIRKQQVRAIRAVRALGFAERAESALLELLGGDDYVVRRTAIDALRDCPSERVDRELKMLLGDDDPRLRDAAQAVIAARNSADIGNPPAELQTTPTE